jgi:hypothetical protein
MRSNAPMFHCSNAHISLAAVSVLSAGRHPACELIITGQRANHAPPPKVANLNRHAPTASKYVTPAIP